METRKPSANRRPLKSRGTRWAAAATKIALGVGLTANQISFLGVLVAAIGAWATVEAPARPWLYALAVGCIQLRLLANLLDGLVAVEGGRGGPTGAIWNEFPDRIEDSLFLVAAGYATGLGWLGWLAALLAAICAYVRLLGGTLGLQHDFGGPMAKPHRMAALTVGLIAEGVGNYLVSISGWVGIALAIITVGTVLTIALRLRRMARQLNEAQ